MEKFSIKDSVPIYKALYLVTNALKAEKYLLLESKYKITSLFHSKNMEFQLRAVNSSTNKKNKKQLSVFQQLLLLLESILINGVCLKIAALVL